MYAKSRSERGALRRPFRAHFQPFGTQTLHDTPECAGTIAQRPVFLSVATPKVMPCAHSVHQLDDTPGAGHGLQAPCSSGLDAELAAPILAGMRARAVVEACDGARRRGCRADRSDGRTCFMPRRTPQLTSGARLPSCPAGWPALGGPLQPRSFARYLSLTLGEDARSGRAGDRSSEIAVDRLASARHRFPAIVRLLQRLHAVVVFTPGEAFDPRSSWEVVAAPASCFDGGGASHLLIRSGFRRRDTRTWRGQSFLRAFCVARRGALRIESAYFRQAVGRSVSGRHAQNICRLNAVDLSGDVKLSPLASARLKARSWWLSPSWSSALHA